MSTLPTLALVLSGLAGTSPAGAAPASELAEVATTRLSALVPGLRQPRPGLYTSAQPDAAAWQALARESVGTVINLRTAEEMAGRDEAAEVAAAGLVYRQIPVGGAADLTTANARALWTALQASEGTTLVHCASGNRVGALLALGAATEGGMAAGDALALGKAAGLAGLEPQVRALLGLPIAD